MKRILSLGLVLTMLCAMLTFMPANAAAIVASGECGTSVTWALDDSGTLTISGTGETYSFERPTGSVYIEQPWYNYNENIKRLVVSNGVTYVGSWAFKNCVNLENVFLSESVKEVGSQAFYGCKKLNQINLPDNLEEIGSSAFYDTGYYNNKKNWENSALYIDNCLIDTQNYEISGKYTIKPGTTLIASGTFNICEGLTDIVFPAGLKYIGAAFDSCDGLTDVVISNGVTKMDGSFHNCKNLKNVVIPNSVIEIENVFKSCNALESIVIPNSITTVNGFMVNRNLKNIILPRGIQRIEGMSFYLCNINNLSIPESVTFIDNGSFIGDDWNIIPNIEIFFGGSQEQWNNIDIGRCLLGDVDGDGWHDYYPETMSWFNRTAPIHYNYNSPLFDVQQSANVTVDGKKLSFDQQPLMIDDRVLVPARAVFEALGASVNWDESAQTVTAVKGGNTVSLVIDSDRMYVNGQIKTLDVPAMVINDRTLVPARAVSEAFGCSVKWDEVYSTVIVESK